MITCSFSFFATAEAISAVGATPVFVDVDPSTYLIDFDQIEAAITPATRALMPVHLFGRAVNMTRLMAIAERHQLKVIEDCAQATGARWKGQAVGSFGDAGCFSFFPTKNLGAAGDGGAVTTSDAALAQAMRELAVHGMPERYLHTSLGYNSRLDAIQAAVLNVKLPKLEAWISKRTAIAERYRDALGDLNGLTLPTADERPQLESVRGAHRQLPQRPAALQRQLQSLQHQCTPRDPGELLPRLGQTDPAGAWGEHDHLLPDSDPPPAGLRPSGLEAGLPTGDGTALQPSAEPADLP